MSRTLRCGDRVFSLGSRTFVMGIVNVTPDSMSDGGRYATAEAAVAHALALLDEGADVLDVGGESTRPGAVPVSVEDECARVLPVLQALAARGIRNLSVDTRNALTAERALAAGAAWVNDVSALGDPRMADVARTADALVLMHARAAESGPRDDRVHYANVTNDVLCFLKERVAHAVSAGIAREALVVDPGIGFGKSLDDNLQLTRDLRVLAVLGPVLYGPSRKRFLGALTGTSAPEARDEATRAAVVAAVQHGADIVRVHDVRGVKHALQVADAIARRASRVGG